MLRLPTMVSRSREKRLTALIADRSSSRRNALAIGLARRGYLVRTARTPLEAIWTLESVAVDLLVLGDMVGRRELLSDLPEDHPEVGIAVLRGDEADEQQLEEVASPVPCWLLGEWPAQDGHADASLASPVAAA